VGRRHEGPRAQGQALQRRPWEHNPLAAFSAASYALNAKVLTGMADAVQADEKTRQRIRFAVEQWVAAMAPSNFLALNPDAQQKAIETRARASPRACRICCTTSAGPCVHDG
jgi:polyhydroxyalkanoate synthase